MNTKLSWIQEPSAHGVTGFVPARLRKHAGGNGTDLPAPSSAHWTSSV